MSDSDKINDLEMTQARLRKALGAAKEGRADMQNRLNKAVEHNFVLQQKVDELRALTTELTGNLMVLKLRGDQNGD